MYSDIEPRTTRVKVCCVIHKHGRLPSNLSSESESELALVVYEIFVRISQINMVGSIINMCLVRYTFSIIIVITEKKQCYDRYLVTDMIQKK